MKKIINELKKNNFICCYGKELIKIWNFFDLDDWENFSNTWSNLRQDKHMMDGGKSRYRRYSRYTYETTIEKLELLPHIPYVQPSYINKLNGDVERVYEPLENSITNTLFFLNYLKWLGNIFSSISNHNKWIINIHQYRIIAGDENGKPTPEGLHRDGVDFVTSLFIKSKNIQGGISSVCDNNQTLITKFEMKQPCDLCLFDDRNVMHEVSQIERMEMNENLESYRDVLVVAFEKC